MFASFEKAGVQLLVNSGNFEASKRGGSTVLDECVLWVVWNAEGVEVVDGAKSHVGWNEVVRG